VHADMPAALRERETRALLEIDPATPEGKEILSLNRATRYIPTAPENYKGLEQAAQSHRGSVGHEWGDGAESTARSGMVPGWQATPANARRAQMTASRPGTQSGTGRFTGSGDGGAG